MPIQLRKTRLFQDWLKDLPPGVQGKILARFLKIELEEHFGDVKMLKGGLAELRFRNGIRIYFYRSAVKEITLVLGGNKNGQKKDIQKAKKLLP